MKLSIITINRNNAEGLRKTIESVVSQTFQDFEYIVIDGASTDNSVDIIEEYADRITYWVSEPDNGIYNAMNKGILKAKGKYLQFLNSGDWQYNNEVLEKAFALNRTEDILYGCDMLFYNENKIVFKDYPVRLSFLFLVNGTISHQGSFIKRKLFESQLYNENYRFVADYDFYVRKIIVESCTTFYIDFPIIFFDMHGISMSCDNEELLLAERKNVLSTYFSEMITNDIFEYNKLKEISIFSLYPYVELFSKFPTLQRWVRGFMKLLLKLVGKNKLIQKK